MQTGYGFLANEYEPNQPNFLLQKYTINKNTNKFDKKHLKAMIPNIKTTFSTC